MTRAPIDHRNGRIAAGRRWAALAATVTAFGLAPLAARGSPEPESTRQMVVTGRLLGPDGKGLGGGQVALLVQQHSRSAKPEGNFFGWGLALRGRLLASSTTDADGRFRISGPGYSPSLPYTAAGLIAGAPGHGLAFRRLDVAAPAQEVTITLAPERVVRGRLIDLQGEPAAQAQVRVVWPEQEFAGLWLEKPPEGVLPFWPRQVRTDDKGRFLVRGLGGAKVHLEVRHERLAPQQFDVEPVAADEPREITLSVVGRRSFQGQVTYGDTRAPAANARLVVLASPDEFGMGYQEAEGRTDGRGRFVLNVFPGDFLRVVVHPPDGTPYRTLRQVVPWAQAAKQETKLALPRGVLVHGKVTEAGTGQPVAGARVQFRPRTNNNPHYRPEFQAGSLEENLETAITGPDGRFQLATPPGPGHLFILGPTIDYVHVPTSWGVLEYGKPGGVRYYPDALVPLDLKPGAQDADVGGITLHRGVTFKGHVVGPDGKPVERFLVFCRSYLPMGYEWWQRENVLEGREGHLELPGCEPGKPCTVWLIDRAYKLGATAELPADAAHGPVTVRLQPCGSAVARFVDPDGKPARGYFNGKPTATYYPMFSMVITPGASMAWSRLTGHDDTKDLEADWFNWLHAPPGSGDLRPDAQGRTTLSALIPGATYRILLPQVPKGGDQEIADKGYPTKDFRVQPGQVLDLGDITVPKQ